MLPSARASPNPIAVKIATCTTLSPQKSSSPPRRDSWNFSRASSPSQPSTIEWRRKSTPPIHCTDGRSVRKNGADARPITIAAMVIWSGVIRVSATRRLIASDTWRSKCRDMNPSVSFTRPRRSSRSARGRSAAVATGTPTFASPRRSASSSRTPTTRFHGRRAAPGGLPSAVSADAPSRDARISWVAPAMTTRSNPARRAERTVRRIVGRPSRGAAGETSTAPSGGTRTSTEPPLTAVASSRRASPPAAAFRPAGWIPWPGPRGWRRASPPRGCGRAGRPRAPRRGIR